MRMKQAPGALLLVCLTCPAAAAEHGKDKQHDSEENAAGAQIIIRTESEKKLRLGNQAYPTGGEPGSVMPNDTSNRQSEPGSLKGLDRAQERRSAEGENSEDGGWYEYLFGKKTAADKTERDWYGYLFGKPQAKQDDPEREKDKEAQEKGNKSTDSRWWPFD